MTTVLPPTLITEYIRAMPTLDLPSLADTNTFPTPSVTVPPNSNNPYILTTNNPNGTVFIAVGAIVGTVLLVFVLYHLIVSITASRTAKKALFNDKQIYEKYQNNNTTAYGLTPSQSTFGFDGNQTMTKLPLLSHHPSKSVGGLDGAANGSGSQFGDTSTLYQSDVGVPASKHDLTKMFISPTAEVMSHKRVKSSQFSSSLTNLSYVNGSNTNLASPNGKRQSTIIPNLYINNESNNSDYSLSTNARSPPPSLQTPSHLHQLGNNQSLNTKQNRKTIPSMYLEDLIDE